MPAFLPTPRQIEFAKLFASGATTKEIAFAMGISIKTAFCHKANLCRKIGRKLSNDIDLTLWCLRQGYLSDDRC